MGMGYGFGAPKLRGRPIRTESDNEIARHAPILVMTTTQIEALPAAGFVPVFAVMGGGDISEAIAGTIDTKPLAVKRKGGRPKGSKNKPKAK